jgi:predicted MPP superfamily phosphohydrolase
MSLAFWLIAQVATLSLLFVVYRWAVDSFPAVRRLRKPAAAATVALVVAPPALRWVVMNWHIGGTLLSALLVVSVSIAIAGLPIGAMRLAAWVVARAGTRRERGEPVGAGAAGPGAAMTRRQLAEAAGGVALLGATGSMLAWGAVRGRHAFELTELPVRIAGLPRALDGYVIAQISDIHAGLYVGERDLDEGLALVRKARPDLVVATGDIVDFDERYASLVARRLGDLAARDGVKAILGNHDYYAGAAGVAQTLRAAGVDVLVDEGRVLRAGDGGFALLGVDDLSGARHRRQSQRPELERAIAMVPPELPRILLSHQPQSVDMWAGQVALQLSGHTHGGQINPGFRPVALFAEYVSGEYSVGGTTLYVNRGFGTVGPPARVGAPPEVTRIVLVAA